MRFLHVADKHTKLDDNQQQNYHTIVYLAMVPYNVMPWLIFTFYAGIQCVADGKANSVQQPVLT